MLSSEPYFKIGDRVRWRPKIAKVDWVGVVSGYPHPRMVQCDGHGCISQGLLEKVGETMHTSDMNDLVQMGLARDAAEAERDGLAEVVAMQCALIMELQTAQPVMRPLIKRQPPSDPTPEESEWFEKLVDHLELYLVHQTGSRRPLAIADVDLRALAAHILD